jgi:hypothetical protein
LTVLGYHLHNIVWHLLKTVVVVVVVAVVVRVTGREINAILQRLLLLRKECIMRGQEMGEGPRVVV